MWAQPLAGRQSEGKYWEGVLFLFQSTGGAGEYSPRRERHLGSTALGGVSSLKDFMIPRFQGSEEEARAPCGKELFVSQGISRSHQSTAVPSSPGRTSSRGVPDFPAMPGGGGRSPALSFRHVPCGIPVPRSFPEAAAAPASRPLLARGSQMCRPGFARSNLQSPPSSPRLRR